MLDYGSKAPTPGGAKLNTALIKSQRNRNQQLLDKRASGEAGLTGQEKDRMVADATRSAANTLQGQQRQVQQQALAMGPAGAFTGQAAELQRDIAKQAATATQQARAEAEALDLQATALEDQQLQQAAQQAQQQRAERFQKGIKTAIDVFKVGSAGATAMFGPQIMSALGSAAGAAVLKLLKPKKEPPPQELKEEHVPDPDENSKSREKLIRDSLPGTVNTL